MTTLRNRFSENQKEGEVDAPATKSEPTDERASGRYVAAVGTMVPEAFQPYFQAVAPYATSFIEFLQSCIPLIAFIRSYILELWALLKPYKPELLIPAFTGIVFCFFGGSYLTLIIAAEAYNVSCGESLAKCYKIVREEWIVVEEKNKEDDKVDHDNNGKADVLEISSSELAKRKTKLFIKTVNPEVVTVALYEMNKGVLAIVSAVKLELPRTIILGNSISTLVLEGPGKKFIVPSLKAVMPPEYQKWAEPLVQYFVKSAAVSFAWYLQRVVSAVHAALRGGKMFADNVLEYLVEMGHITEEQKSDLKLDIILGPVLAIFGLWFQISRSFTLPFPLNVLMFPFTVVEYALIWAATR